MKKNKLVIFDWGNIVESHTVGYNGIIAWNDLFEACGGTTEKGNPNDAKTNNERDQPSVPYDGARRVGEDRALTDKSRKTAA